MDSQQSALGVPSIERPSSSVGAASSESERCAAAALLPLTKPRPGAMGIQQGAQHHSSWSGLAWMAMCNCSHGRMPGIMAALQLTRFCPYGSFNPHGYTSLPTWHLWHAHGPLSPQQRPRCSHLLQTGPASSRTRSACGGGEPWWQFSLA